METNISLAPKTTLKVGGNAEYFVRAASVRKIADVVREVKEKSLALTILSGGTNTLVSDGGVSGAVLQPALKEERVVEKNGEEIIVTASAGEDWDEFVAWTVEQGWWGVENLSLIPGWVGASPYQNIGAYGAEVANVIKEVVTFDTFDEKEKIFSVEECDFGYRMSFFKKLVDPRHIITSVVFRLSATPRPNLSYRDIREFFTDKPEPTLAEIRNAVVQIRTNKLPDMEKCGTAGSYFMNPVVSEEKAAELLEKFPTIPTHKQEGGVKIPLAWILDSILHLKGYRKEHVALYEKQPLVIVTEPGATAAEVLALEAEVKEKVFAVTGIEIEREVRCIGVQ